MNKPDILKLSIVPLILLGVAIVMFVKLDSLALDPSLHTDTNLQQLAKAIGQGTVQPSRNDIVALLQQNAQMESYFYQSHARILGILKKLAILIVSFAVLHFILLYTLIVKRKT